MLPTIINSIIIILLILGSPAYALDKTTDALPGALSMPLDNAQSIGTPDYVIIRSSNQTTFSSEISASVAELSVKEGSHFNKGDVLLSMDCRVQKAELKKALAQYQSASIAKQSAAKLKAYGAISEFELVKATAEEKIASAEVDRLNPIIEKCTIRAPFNGAVSELMIHPYETVKQGEPLLKIVSTDNLEFEMQIPSCWLDTIHVGTVFTVHIGETNQTISATVTKINPQIEPVSQSVKLVAIITPNNPSLLPGMSGQAHFPANKGSKCGQMKS